MSAMEAPKPAETKPKKKGYAPKGHVNGLAKDLADREPCRVQLLQHKTLLRWPDPKLTGMCTGRALKLNKPVMLAVAGDSLPAIRAQAGSGGVQREKGGSSFGVWSQRI